MRKDQFQRGASLSSSRGCRCAAAKREIGVEAARKGDCRRGTLSGEKRRKLRELAESVEAEKRGEGRANGGNKYWKPGPRETQTVITNISGGDRKTSQIFNWFPSLLLLGSPYASFVFIVEIGRGVRAEEAPIPSGLVAVRSYFRINPLFSSPHFVSKTY